jgi:glycosyltransferase involved in cell wall biosynthesis
LPELSAPMRDTLDAVSPNAYATTIERRPDCFISLSPMTHDSLPMARLIGDDRILRVAVVYDFIPLREPDRYLPNPAAKLAYSTATLWLSRFDRYAPISRSALQDLRRVVGVGPDRAVVTGCPLNATFRKARIDEVSGNTPAHVLFVGGGDPRKDPLTVIRAHARSSAMQSGQGVPLILGGHYTAHDAEEFRALASLCGGRAELVQIPGPVSDEALLRNYQNALAVITASRDEGFSLPVIEGMATGRLCLCSDIPAHRELLDDESQLFAPGDDGRLAALLDRALADRDWRMQAIEAQDAVWPRYQTENVAERFWSPIVEALVERRPTDLVRHYSVSRRRLPRIAMLTPLPPERSGVADYSAVTGSALARMSELHLFTETKNCRDVENAASLAPLSDLAGAMPGFDRVITVMGNSHYHLRIYRILERFGGACILHDARLLGFYRGLLGLDRTLAAARDELSRPVTEDELGGWLHDESKTEALFLGELARMSRPLIVHSGVTAAQVQQRHSVEARYVPFSIYRPTIDLSRRRLERAAARARLGLAPDTLVIATFGFIHSSKGPEHCIRALDLLRGWGLPATLHFVGEIADRSDPTGGVQELARRFRVQPYTFLSGSYVSEERYGDFLLAADAAVQLRTYGFGSISGALMDCAAMGLPTVANHSLAAALDLRVDYVRTVSDTLNSNEIASSLFALLKEADDPAWAEVMLDQCLTFNQERNPAVYAKQLCEALDLEPRLAPV